MKLLYPLTLMLPFVLVSTGCEQTRPEVLRKLIFAEEGDWLERDPGEDPLEWVSGECCNDFNPYPLPIDTLIEAVISPGGDLDYFNLRITDTYAGQLFLQSERDNITMRLFTRDLEEHEFFLETLDAALAEPVYWTTVYGPLDSLTVLVAGDSRRSQGAYTLEWRPVIPVTYLAMNYPDSLARWQRGTEYTIRRQYGTVINSRLMSVALIKGPVVVDVLVHDLFPTNRLRWPVPEDLEPGDDYRIMVYLSNEPNTLAISHAFEIN